MKKLYASIAIIFALFFLISCGTKSLELTLPERKVSIPEAEKQKVIPTSSKIETKVGDILTYSFKSNSSVGNSTEYTLDDGESIVEQDSNSTSECDMPGCGSKTTLKFTAQKLGTSTLTIKKLYRGTLIQEHKFIISVK